MGAVAPKTNQQTKTEDVIEECRQMHNEKGHTLAFLHRTEWDGINHNVAALTSRALLV